jgi:CheY-like chemotaxis protein
MNVVPRPPPLVLFIQNHARVEILFEYLASAGLRVARTLNDRDMLATVLRLVPDLIVLDFNGKGDTVERLKADSRTMSIPLIALAETAAGTQDRLLLN